MSKRKTFELIQLAAVYDKQFSDELIKIYVEDLELLSDEETVAACKLYRQNPKNEFFPRPIAKLVQLVKNPVSNEDIAANVAAELLKLMN